MKREVACFGIYLMAKISSLINENRTENSKGVAGALYELVTGRTIAKELSGTVGLKESVSILNIQCSEHFLMSIQNMNFH